MRISYPGESPEYRAARDRLLQMEIELRRATEEVAAARRALPPGGIIPQDYVFQQEGENGIPTDVKLSELFKRGLDTLVIYNFMFPRALDDELPCPHCTSILDSLDGAAPHIGQRVNLVVAAKVPLPQLLAHGRARGWRKLRLVSSAANTYSHDYFGENTEGAQMPMLNVFQIKDGMIRHFWGSELSEAPIDPGQDQRHVDFINPIWNLFDVTPHGRGTN